MGSNPKAAEMLSMHQLQTQTLKPLRPPINKGTLTPHALARNLQTKQGITAISAALKKLPIRIEILAITWQ